MSWLYRYEAKGIQSWIMSTDRLREMGGGSAIVEGLAGRVRAAAGSLGVGDADCVLAAGNGLVRLPSRQAATDLAAAVAIAMSQLAPGLQLASAVVANEGDEQMAMEESVRAVGLARNAPAPSLPEAGPLAVRSAQTGLPAVRRHGATLLDAAMDAKLREFQRAGDRALAQRLGLGGTEFVTDHDQLGDGYVAVLHADGTGVGNRIKDACTTFERNRRVSSALRGATEQATATAIRAVFVPAARPGADGRNVIPARVVVLGGDDLTLLCAAEDAIPFAHVWASEFERLTASCGDALGGGGLHAGIGIALVKRHWPFRDAYELAEGLCAAAKAPARGRAVSPLLFHRVTTSLVGDWREIKNDELRSASGEPGALSGGPYAAGSSVPPGWVSTAQLDELRSALALQPRGAARGWLRLAMTDAAAARDRWKRWRTVVSGRQKDDWDRFTAALSPWGCTPDAPGPWGTNNHGENGRRQTVTPVGDALALSSLLRAGEEA